MQINVSHALTAILLSVHLGAMTLIAVVPLAWPVKIGVWAILIWSLRRTIRLHARRIASDAVAEIEIDSERELSVRLAGGTAWQNGRLGASFVHPWVMLLSLRLDGRKWPVSVVVAADAVEPEAFRRWRVALRHHAVAG